MRTPGPWYVADRKSIVRSKVERTSSKGSGVKFHPIVATAFDMHDPTAESEANAILIAAAPDLLTRCHEAKDIIGYAIEFLDNGTPINSGSELHGDLRNVLGWLKTTIAAAGDEIS